MEVLISFFTNNKKDENSDENFVNEQLILNELANDEEITINKDSKHDINDETIDVILVSLKYKGLINGFSS